MKPIRTLRHSSYGQPAILSPYVSAARAASHSRVGGRGNHPALTSLVSRLFLLVCNFRLKGEAVSRTSVLLTSVIIKG